MRNRIIERKSRLYEPTRTMFTNHGPTAAGPSELPGASPHRAGYQPLLPVGAQCWVCRSAHAAMRAMRKSGVKFRTLVHNDGTTERWRQPRLAPWEIPRPDPAEPRPNAPEVTAQRRAARLARQRARNAT